MNILLIEDDIPLNTTITDYLTENKKCNVTSMFDGDDAIDVIDNMKFDLYIIDINIPNISGIELTKYIRQKDLDSIIIVITASLELANFKQAFSYGCSDYIKKPFFLEELEIRINNLMNKSLENNIIDISKNITYDIEYEILFIDEQPVNLRKKEKRLLNIFLKNINKTISNEEITNYVWENEIREKFPLRQLVSDLNNKLKSNKKLIFSESGIGYRFEIEDYND